MGPLVRLPSAGRVRAQIAQDWSERRDRVWRSRYIAQVQGNPISGRLHVAGMAAARGRSDGGETYYTSTEAFGPVATVMAYDNLDQA